MWNCENYNHEVAKILTNAQICYNDREIIYKILNDKNKLLYRSQIKLANLCRNLRIDSPNERNVVSTRGNGSKPRTMAMIDPDDLIGRTYLSDPDSLGDRNRLEIVEAIDRHKDEMFDDPDMIKFLCSTGDGEYDEIKTYNELLDKVEQGDDEQGLSRFF